MIDDHRTNRMEPTVLETPDLNALTADEREAWHRRQEDLERSWLDDHIRALSPYTIAA